MKSTIVNNFELHKQVHFCPFWWGFTKKPGSVTMKEAIVRKQMDVVVARLDIWLLNHEKKYKMELF